MLACPYVVCMDGGGVGGGSSSPLNKECSKGSSGTPTKGSSNQSNPESNKSSKFEEFSDLRESKKDIEGTINDNKNILGNIQKAEELDKNLPEQAKESNSHINDLKEEFSSFFDKNSGNTTVKESLDEIKEFVEDEQRALKSELEEITGDLNKLVLDSSNQNTSSSSNKRERSSEYTETEGANKRSRGNNNNDEPGGGSGSLPPSSPSGPSAPSSGPSPPSPTSSSSSNVADDGSVDNSVESKCYYTQILLDIIISFLKAIAEDDSHMD